MNISKNKKNKKKKAISQIIKNNQALWDLFQQSCPERAEEYIIQIGLEREARLKACDTITVQRSIPLDMFNKYAGDYDTMSEELRNKVLYNLGYATDIFLPVVFHTVQRQTGGTVHVFKEILGQERLDREWIQGRRDNGTRQCSEEAREYIRNKRDPSWGNHISTLLGG